MRIYLFIAILFCGCHNKEKELNRKVSEAGIDLRKYLKTEDTVYYYQTFPRIQLTTGIDDESIFERQDSMLNTLPQVNLDLVKLCYYNLIVDSLLLHQATVIKEQEQRDKTSIPNRTIESSTATSSAISSLALIKSNRPFSFFLSKNNSLQFSYGINPVFVSALGLTLVSSSAISMISQSSGHKNEFTDSALVESIRANFQYHMYMFELTDDLDSLIDNTIYMARILHDQKKIGVGTTILEQYFVDYLAIKGKITANEKNNYLSFISNFDKKLPDKFEFTDQDTYRQLTTTRSAIASGVLLMESSINTLNSNNETIAYFKNKASTLISELKKKNYKAPLEKFHFRFLF